MVKLLRNCLYSIVGLVVFCCVAFSVYAVATEGIGAAPRPTSTPRIIRTNTPRPTPKPTETLTPQAEIEAIFDQMEIAWIGNPSRREIKPLLDAVMLGFDLELTAENYSRAGSTLVGLRQMSEEGFTEMDILKEMSTYPTTGLTFPKAAGLALVALEAED